MKRFIRPVMDSKWTPEDPVCPEMSSHFLGEDSAITVIDVREDPSKYVPVDGYWSPEVEKMVENCWKTYIYKRLTQ